MASKILLRTKDVLKYDDSVRCIHGLCCEKRFSVTHVVIIAKGNTIEGIEAKV